MKCACLMIALFSLPFVSVAQCDLTRFHGNCEIPWKLKPTRHTPALVYCGNLYGYVTKAQYDEMVRYQRADVNLILTVNGEYIDSPCIPYRR